MRYINKICLIAFISMIGYTNSYAYKYLGAVTKAPEERSVMAGCQPATSYTDLDIGNVRARINTGGDMWWDLQGNSRYYIPKDSKKTAMYSASLWMAGKDANGQLKCAAQRYRSEGTDFWTGPLSDDGTASVDAATCAAYDKHFKITKSEVAQFIAWYNDNGAYPDYTVPTSIKNWPGNGDVTKGQTSTLAPYMDVNLDGHYDPADGDYPYYDFENKTCGDTSGAGDRVLFGDQTLWWVFNDKGNVHSESKGSPVGFEIRAQAFAFATNDEINNMTFYNFQIINRSTYTLKETYFSLWTDTDLGYGFDDYVGCDVTRGLGYCYNGKAVDGSGKEDEYGANPPAVGVDFFQGPYLDKNKKADRFYPDSARLGKYAWDSTSWCGVNGVGFNDTIQDNERFGMRRFVYHDNVGGSKPAYMTDPEKATEYYNMLRGIWKDNTPMSYGGNGHPKSGAYGPACDFMFPGMTDEYNWGTKGQNLNGPKNWTEETAKNEPYDRRFMHSAGPFQLNPGATNYITVGIPWARATSGGPFASVEALKIADDKCQRLFDNCFRVVDGPDAPDVTIQEFDKELVLMLTNNNTSSNNYREMYPYKQDGSVNEYDFNIITPDSSAQIVVHNASYKDSIFNKKDSTYTLITKDTAYTQHVKLKKKVRYDSLYHFQGYMVYQLKDISVSASELENPDKARLVAQCDIKDNISTIINYEYDQSVSATVAKLKVTGENKGLKHVFKLTEDAFAEKDRALINHKEYYYMAVAYAYNNYKDYSQTDPLLLDGQKLPFKASRMGAVSSIKPVVGIPHIVSPENAGTVLNTEFGFGPKITRVEGHGNGGLFLELTKESEDKILAATSEANYKGSYSSINLTPEYESMKGPVEVKVIDPLSVISDDFLLKFDQSGNINNSKWTLTNEANSITYTADQSISVSNEQVIPELGLSVLINQCNSAGFDIEDKFQNGLIGSSITQMSFDNMYLGFVNDNDEDAPENWIRAGIKEKKGDSYNDASVPDTVWKNKVNFIDPNQNYEKIVNGTWAPYVMTLNPDGSIVNTPGMNHSQPATTFGEPKIQSIGSVDIVFTKDKSKWTRCPVVETSNDECSNSILLGKGMQKKLNSRDIDGNEIAGEFGMSWFPGYAICTETGERLNIAFGEDSKLESDGGNDMWFNPSSNYKSGDVPIWGGKHFIYVFGHQTTKVSKEKLWGKKNLVNCPAYDRGHWLDSTFKVIDSWANAKPNPQPLYVQQMIQGLYSNCWYTSIPMSYPNTESNWLSTDLRIKIRINKPFAAGSNTNGEDVSSLKMSQSGDGSGAVNNNRPMYRFSTKGLSPSVNQDEVAENALDLIKVVPNPYYAFSTYERNQLDNRVKIANLPVKCEVSIYTMNGTLIRRFNKDEEKTSIEWDLKNTASITISSGVYLIHIKADGIGERTIKWFGAMRPADIDAF